ncbi:MAG: Slam-dependent surface lipoprotein [Neisseria sp.]|uniref:Slam-dependent surface lipoprotein n=1 Tax=Neisseria sp. TaxID=192066 RepID=UPI0026DBAF23|nr:Slam-dependent surface lipoprotein [Neisseria sp.]MDO4640866.1 Slam-dependent surface lipoprotein [Neisseria sp.]
MKHQKLTLILSALTLASLAPAALAETVSGISDSSQINVGPLTRVIRVHKGNLGDPGIGKNSFSGGTRVSFLGLQSFAQNRIGGSYDRYGVTRIPNSGTDHGTGAFNFQQVAGHNAYYGEWSATGRPTDATRTVYYSGREKSTSLPTGAVVNYQVKGINRYNGGNLLTGNLRGDFRRNTLTGSLKNSSFTLGINARIVPANATFNGTATAAGLRGNTHGHFFGNRATGVAGIATFNNRTYNTAFGGKR